MVVLKEDHKEEQRNKVLAGALECFYSKGYDAATIDDIVKQSGVSKGSIYKLFKSKEEIYIQVIERNTNDLMDEIRTILGNHSTAQEKITSLFTEYLSKNFGPHSLKWFLVQSEFELFSSRREDMMKLLAEIRLSKLELISNVIIEGIQNGEFKKEIDVALYSNIFWSFVDGAFTHKIHFPDYPYLNLIKGQKDIFLQKLFK